MKKHYFFLVLVISIFGCQSQQAVSGVHENQVNNRSGVGEVSNLQSAITLDDALRRIPGIMVMGSGNGAKIRVRGISNSFISDSTPLFVVDGNILGHDYQSLSRSISVNDIDNIRVLKNSSETSLYGARGSNGVIVITSKRGGD